jgi:serine/threonine-protein kinase HipA
MAVQAGIAMAPCRLLEESGRAHFMTKRFDRDGNTKLHTQTLCGMAQLDYRAKGVHDCSQYLAAMRQLKMGPGPLEQAFRRIAFNVMATNCDDHTKNISFIMHEQGEWEPAPAYDLIYAYNPEGEWTYQHLMSVNGKFQHIEREDLLVLADRFQIGAAPRLIAEVRSAVAAWPDFGRPARVSQQAIDRIRNHHVLL